MDVSLVDEHNCFPSFSEIEPSLQLALHYILVGAYVLVRENMQSNS